MEKPPVSFSGLLTNMLLLGLLAVLVFIALRLPAPAEAPRYTFTAHSNTHEIFVFDSQTGKLYITYPGLIDSYNGEAWAELNPLDRKNIIPFKRYLDDIAGKKIQDDFVNRLNAQKAQNQGGRQDGL